MTVASITYFIEHTKDFDCVNHNKLWKILKEIAISYYGRFDGKKICLQCGRPRFNPRARKIYWRREWLPTPAFLPGKFHGQRSLAGYSPWGHKEVKTTEQLALPSS